MARSTLQIKFGSYTGNGSAQTITGIGFRPDMVILKGETNNPPFRTKLMRGDSTMFLASATAGTTGVVTELLNDGFSVGTDATVSTNTRKYYYCAIRSTHAQSYFRIGRYYGNAVDNTNYTGGGLNFTPDLVVLKGDTAQQPVFRTSTMPGDLTGRLDAGSHASNQIQNVQSNGFQLGTDARVNSSGLEYHYFAALNLPGVIATGRYTGNGTSLSITGLGFKPDLVVVKVNAAVSPRMMTKTMVADATTSPFMTTTATNANGITSLDVDGFSVGSDTSVNTSAGTHDWFALKEGNYTPPMSRRVP